MTRTYNAMGSLTDRGVASVSSTKRGSGCIACGRAARCSRRMDKAARGERVTKQAGSDTLTYVYDEGGHLIAEYRKAGCYRQPSNASTCGLDGDRCDCR